MRTLNQLQEARTGHRKAKVKLYNSKRWKELRKWFLTYNPTCVACKENGRLRSANVVDHVLPHAGNERMFWDTDNLQALCTQCHNIKSNYEKTP